MDISKGYYGYNRVRSRADVRGKNSLITGKRAANILVQIMVCLVLMLSMLYVRYNQNGVTDPVCAYTALILKEDIDFAKVYTDSTGFWSKLFATTVEDTSDATASASAEPGSITEEGDKNIQTVE